MEVKTWNADPAHSNIGFSVKHMMFSKVKGSFEQYDASITMEKNDFETAKLSFEAKSDSITTNNKDRDTHLRSQEFFDVEKNPTVKFESTKVKKKGDNNFLVEGDLTMNGITNAVSLEAEYSGVMKDPWGNDRFALVLKTQINRHDWNMKWNQALEGGGILVSKEVGFDIESQFI